MRVWFCRISALCCVLTLVASIPLRADVRSSINNDVSELASPTHIEQYVHDRLQVPAAVNVTAQPVKPSGVPHFYQTLVTLADGKQTRAFNAFITDDARCFALGSVFALNGASEAEIIRCIRQAVSLPAAAKVTVGAFTPLRYRDFVHATVTVQLGTKVDRGTVYVSQDRRSGAVGVLFPYRRDFARQLIETRNQPSTGAAGAPVTIVEYADLECPRCAYFQKFLESEFLPRYKSHVRIVLKEFPLPFHPWSTTAAIANECAYQIAPATFFDYRSLIFANQSDITADNVRERVLGLGETVGINRAKLSACLDSKASMSRIEASRAEAESLGIDATPTFAINGRVVVNIPSPEAFNAIVEQSLAEAHR